MALSIKTEEADRLARELSRLTGESMTQAVTVALRERLERVPRPPSPVRTPEEIAKRTQEILDAAAAFRARLPGADFRPATKAEFDALWEDGTDGPAGERKTGSDR